MVDGLGLFTVGGDVAADGGEAGCAGGAAELSADLGLEFDHAQVAFGLIVVERQGGVAGVGEEHVAVFAVRGDKVPGVLFVPCSYVRVATGNARMFEDRHQLTTR